MSESTPRIDKWLWSVRITKTRADAADLCRSGHVKVNGKTVKPSAKLVVGDRIETRVHELERAYPGEINVATVRAGAQAFFAADAQVRPLDLDKLHFESRCGGRVAHARHVEGGYVIDASRPGEPELPVLEFDPVMTWHEGQWKVLR